MGLELTMICGPYDRARALIDGTVRVRGVDLKIVVNSNDAMRQQQSRERKFDIVEFYTGIYITDLSYRTFGFTAIPIFVKRMFRHSYIYVNKLKRIRTASDLNGKRIGVQAWTNTTSLWARGILEDDYGLDIRSVTWVAEKRDSVGEWKPPSWLRLEFAPNGETSEKLLEAGSIDAAVTTKTLAPKGHQDVAFLFPNYAELEREWFRRTGFFPIMHTLLIKNEVLEKNPWVAMSVFDAWEESKQRCYEWLEWQRVHQTSMWFRALWEEERAVAGTDIYPWGFNKTRAEVDKMLEYAQRHGLTQQRFKPEDMFHPSILNT
jgi:4,5-dihydroxyphthalate decarboxylase